MAEFKRLESTDLDAADRDSRVETLLVEGLDQYFNSRYEEAIHIWTRVLFLDRSHGRARAYIDRARTAVSERQRRAEELLQAGQTLLDQGRISEARQVLTEILAAGGEDEQASALRVKLERAEHLERLAGRPRLRSTAAQASPVPVPAWTWPRRSRVGLVLGTVAVAGLLLVATVTSPSVQDWVGLRSSADRLDASASPEGWPLLSVSDAALVRARTLYGRGRLAEALQALDRVSPGSQVRAEADQLRVQIQQMLLGSGPPLAPPKAARQ
jgi:tetratricopeptide (TPR) repeat protein